MTQMEAGEILGIQQARVSALTRNRVFLCGRLIDNLLALNSL